MKTLYLIGGLPSSGTSALAGSLYFSDVSMDFKNDIDTLSVSAPETSKRSSTEYTKFELRSVVGVNEMMMHNACQSGGLKNPPHPDSLILSKNDAPEIRRLMSSIPSFPFAMKDPRFAITWAVWKKAAAELGLDIKFIFSVRDPMENATSLKRRGWVPSVKAGLDLWLRYNLSVLECFNTGDTYIISYDQEDYVEQLREMTRRMGVRLNVESVRKHLRFSERGEIRSLDESPLKESIESLYYKLWQVSL